MSELPTPPTDPAGLKAWVAALSPDDLQSLTHQIIGGAFASHLLGPGEEQGPRNRAIDLPPPPAQQAVLTVTIELRGSRPRIWRRLSLPGGLTLDAVHILFQAAMGWTDSHLHRFEPGDGRDPRQPYFITRFDEEEGDGGTREDAVRLDQVLRTPGDRLTYSYDFGDGWEHRVTLESVSPLPPGGHEPTCLGGARACPLEDVGGIGGHQEIVAWLRSGAPADAVPGAFDDADHAHGWLGQGYDPDAFDAAEATAAMRQWANGEHLPWHGLPPRLAELLQTLRGQGWVQIHTWLTELAARTAVDLDEAELRTAARPWLAVLQAVGAGTKLTAAGYLPPALVEQIAHAAGITHWWIGRCNREDITWPVADLRTGAQDLGLLRKAKGTLAPTARARTRVDHPARLVAGVLERLPLGKGFEADAGWFALLGMAVGRADADLHDAVAAMLTDRGWRAQDGSQISAGDARRGSRPTVGILSAMAGDVRDPDPALLERLARAVLFGVGGSA